VACAPSGTRPYGSASQSRAGSTGGSGNGSASGGSSRHPSPVTVPRHARRPTLHAPPSLRHRAPRLAAALHPLRVDHAVLARGVEAPHARRLVVRARDVEPARRLVLGTRRGLDDEQARVERGDAALDLGDEPRPGAACPARPGPRRSSTGRTCGRSPGWGRSTRSRAGRRRARRRRGSSSPGGAPVRPGKRGSGRASAGAASRRAPPVPYTSSNSSSATATSASLKTPVARRISPTRGRCPACSSATRTAPRTLRRPRRRAPRPAIAGRGGFRSRRRERRRERRAARRSRAAVGRRIRCASSAC
jgi:hypothetical protein